MTLISSDPLLGATNMTSTSFCSSSKHPSYLTQKNMKAHPLTGPQKASHSYQNTATIATRSQDHGSRTIAGSCKNADPTLTLNVCSNLSSAPKLPRLVLLLSSLAI